MGLFGDEFEIKPKEKKVKDLVKKVKEPKVEEPAEISVEKVLKSKKITLAERLDVIRTNVLKTLGKQKDNILVIKDLATFEDYITKAIESGRIAVDTETNNSTDTATCKLMGLCLYYPEGKQAYIPINHRDPETKEKLAWQLTEKDCHDQLKRVTEAQIDILMHNGKFDIEVLYFTCGIKVYPTWDTLVAARQIDENKFKDAQVGLKSIYTTYIDSSQEKYKIDELFENVAYADVDPDIFAYYAATDSLMTDKVYLWERETFFDLPENEKVLKLVKTIEFPIIPVTAAMEARGVFIDQELGERLKVKYNKQLEDLDVELAKIFDDIKPIIDAWKETPDAKNPTKQYVADKSKMTQEKIEKMYPCVDEKGKRYKIGKAKVDQLEDPINLASSTQMAILLFDILGCPTVNNRAVGEDEIKEIKDKLAIKENKNNKVLAAEAICDKLLTRRGIVKLITTYVDVIPDLAKHWPDGRIRYRLNSTGTDTGRFASGGKFKFLDENENPVVLNSINSQNIPSHNPEIRLLFKAAPGYKIVGSDYSGQEIRLAAYLSKDEKLLQSYAADKDVYAMIASEMFGLPYEDCLEFYPEGTEIEVDGQKVIAGHKTHTNKEGKERRAVGKTMVLAGNYGMSGAGAGALMHKTAKEGTELLSKYFEMFPGLKTAIEQAKERLKECGYVEDVLGRRRRLPDIYLNPYEATYKDSKKVTEMTFNPLLDCENRPLIDNKLADYLDRASYCKSNKDYSTLAGLAEKEGIVLKANTGRIAQAERQCFNAMIQGCLSYDSLIYTKEYGICKIGDLANKYITVWDGNDWSSAHVTVSGKKQKCVLTTTLGNKIVCSPDHRFKVVNTRGTYSFKKLKDLLPQDRLVVEESAPSITNKLLLRDIFNLESKAINANNYSFDDIKDDYIRGQVLGRIASDGSYGYRDNGGSYVYLLVAEHESELLDYFAKNLPFKYSISIEQKKNQKIYRIEIYSTSLVKECIELNLKHQIHNYFYSNTDLLRGFISGFFDGDGTASANNITLDFGIQADFSKIISQMQNALLIFGIRSTAKIYKDRHRVTIRRFDSKLFAERIGFITKSKQLLAENKTTVLKNKCFNNQPVVLIKNIEFTDDYIDMFDVCDTERGYFVTNGVVTHNSAGTLTKKAMIDIFNDKQLQEWDTHLIITVHDEVLVECPEQYAELVEKRLPEIMIKAALDLGIVEPKMKCDPYNVSRWYADSAAVTIRSEFSKLMAKGKLRDEALAIVIKNHTEIPEEAIIASIETGCDLEF